MPELTRIPSQRVNLIDPRTGLMTREWFLFFQNLFELTGGGSNSTTVQDLQTSPLSMPTDTTVQDSNQVLTWLSM